MAGEQWLLILQSVRWGRESCISSEKGWPRRGHGGSGESQPGGTRTHRHAWWWFRRGWRRQLLLLLLLQLLIHLSVIAIAIIISLQLPHCLLYHWLHAFDSPPSGKNTPSVVREIKTTHKMLKTILIAFYHIREEWDEEMPYTGNGVRGRGGGKTLVSSFVG